LDKCTLRRQILTLRDQLSVQERGRGDILVTEKILGHQWYYGAEYLLLFASYGSEISTDLLLEEALRSGKKVYLPKVEDKNITFYQIDRSDDLKEGYRGIREPMGDTGVYPASEQLADRTLMIMPGVAFDHSRNRIGYGGGYYDRYLQDKAWMRTIAIGYQCQMVDHIPAKEWDIRPGQVICF